MDGSELPPRSAIKAANAARRTTKLVVLPLRLDKVKRVLAHHGASLRDAVKVTTYITDLRHRLTLGQCVKDTWGDVVFPTNTLIGVGALAFPEMIIEVDVTAIVTAK